MKTVVFIAPQISQPRIIKRITAVYESGIPVKVYGFDNGLYSCNLDSIPFPIAAVLPRKKDSSRMTKIIFFIREIKRIINLTKENSIFYFFGYEIGFFAYCLGCKAYVYEEADVSAARIQRRLLRKMLVYIDKRIIKKSLCTIFTSGGFVRFLFPGKEKPSKILLLPNKLSPWFNQMKKECGALRKFDDNHLIFGFVGLIRYPNTIIRFAKVIGRRFPQHEFHFYGDVERKEYIDEELLSYTNVYFHGPFLNPHDLQSIYAQIDVNVVCYDTSSGNVNIAEPNKLYESIFFEVPMVVSSQTYLAYRVAEMNAGYDIDASVDENIMSFVKSLHGSDLERISSGMRTIDRKTLVDDSTELVDKLRQLL